MDVVGPLHMSAVLSMQCSLITSRALYVVHVVNKRLWLIVVPYQHMVLAIVLWGSLGGCLQPSLNKRSYGNELFDVSEVALEYWKILGTCVQLACDVVHLVLILQFSVKLVGIPEREREGGGGGGGKP